MHATLGGKRHARTGGGRRRDRGSARAIAAVLKAGGFVSDDADRGEEAIGLGRHYDYDIVLLDLLLPDMDGYEVIRRLRREGAMISKAASLDHMYGARTNRR
jgi:DNA-binding response OmpR family regulator